MTETHFSCRIEVLQVFFSSGDRARVRLTHHATYVLRYVPHHLYYYVLAVVYFVFRLLLGYAALGESCGTRDGTPLALKFIIRGLPHIDADTLHLNVDVVIMSPLRIA